MTAAARMVGGQRNDGVDDTAGEGEGEESRTAGSQKVVHGRTAWGVTEREHKVETQGVAPARDCWGWRCERERTTMA